MLDEIEVNRLASRLAIKLAPFAPTRVIYIENGGQTVGEAIARDLCLPATGVDIGYPVSRVGRALPRNLLFPVKELAYRLTSPRLRQPLPPLPAGERLALVDDSASSGKTVQIALLALKDMGIGKESIEVAVIRCGRRARSYVDHFEIERPVLFVGR